VLDNNGIEVFVFLSVFDTLKICKFYLDDLGSGDFATDSW